MTADLKLRYGFLYPCDDLKRAYKDFDADGVMYEWLDDDLLWVEDTAIVRYDPDMIAWRACALKGLGQIDPTRHRDCGKYKNQWTVGFDPMDAVDQLALYHERLVLPPTSPDRLWEPATRWDLRRDAGYDRARGYDHTFVVNPHSYGIELEYLAKIVKVPEGYVAYAESKASGRIWIGFCNEGPLCAVQAMSEDKAPSYRIPGTDVAVPYEVADVLGTLPKPPVVPAPPGPPRPIAELRATRQVLPPRPRFKVEAAE